MAYKHVTLAGADGIVRLTLNRPDKLNALSVALGEDLLAALAEVAADPKARVLVITGAGRAFCSGGEMDEVLRANADPWVADHSVRIYLDIVRSIRTLKIPVIARINGDAIGGGCCLALSCDLKVAAQPARLGLSFVRIGLSACDMGATYLLPRLIGLARATEFLLLGAVVDADEAQRLGMINRVVAPEALDATVAELAERLARGPALAQQITKQALERSFSVDFAVEMELEAYAQGLCIQSADVREGVLAFKERRQPRFGG